ncbi:MAG: aspartate kinase [Bacteroidales bacterium]|nr:aspartate kinase [Bacteroidales bacterium]
MIVMKFGGTSVQDAAAIKRVIEIVKGRLSQSPLVVVSAMARVTRSLVEITSAADQRPLVEALLVRHLEACDQLLEGQLLSDTKARVESLCRGILGCHDQPEVISVGELLSSTIVAAAFNAAGIPCGWADAREMVCVGGDRMGGRPDFVKTEEAVRNALGGHGLTVTQGFIARTAEGRSAVLGFEGSDYSAAIFGMALDADSVEIWTDVDGIRTADPRLVSDTCRIPEISYDEAAEMARLGARVLHPMTIYPARTKNIPIIVLNTGNPSCEGSRVVRNEDIPDGPKSVALLTLQDSREIGSKALAGESEGRALVSLIGRNMSDMHRLAVEETALCEAAVEPLSISVTVSASKAGEIANQIHKKIFG